MFDSCRIRTCVHIPHPQLKVVNVHDYPTLVLSTVVNAGCFGPEGAKGMGGLRSSHATAHGQVPMDTDTSLSPDLCADVLCHHPGTVKLQVAQRNGSGASSAGSTAAMDLVQLD